MSQQYEFELLILVEFLTMCENLESYEEFICTDKVEFEPYQLMILWDYPGDPYILHYVSRVVPCDTFPFKVPNLLPYKHGALYESNNREVYVKFHGEIKSDDLRYL